METSIRMCFPRNNNELRSVRSCTCKLGRFKVFWAEWTARIGEEIVFSRIEVWVLVLIRRRVRLYRTSIVSSALHVYGYD